MVYRYHEVGNEQDWWEWMEQKMIPGLYPDASSHSIEPSKAPLEAVTLTSAAAAAAAAAVAAKKAEAAALTDHPCKKGTLEGLVCTTSSVLVNNRAHLVGLPRIRTLRSKPVGCAVNPGFEDVTDVCIVR